MYLLARDTDMGIFDKGRAAHGALLALFRREHACRNNPKALETARLLCDAAIDAVNDVDARVAIRTVKHLANLFFADDGHLGVESELAGPEAIRLRILNALSDFRGRIQTLETRAPSRPEIAALAHKHLSALVVEDNRDSAETLRALLEIVSTFHHSPRRSALKSAGSQDRTARRTLTGCRCSSGSRASALCCSLYSRAICSI